MWLTRGVQRIESTFERLAAQALTLTPDEREAFVQLLSASLEDDSAADDELDADIAQRVADIESGAAHPTLMVVRAGLK